MKKFFSLLFREFKLFGSNSIALAIFVGAPLAYALLLGGVYKKANVTELPIVVVDLDNTPTSNKIIEALDDNQYLDVKEIRQYASRDVEKLLIREDFHAVLTIPDRFEADLNQKRHPEIDVDVDAANMLTGNYVSAGVMRVLGTINAGVEIEGLKKKGMPTAIAMEQFEAFKLSVNKHYNPSSNYLLYLFPGMLGAIMQQVFLIGLALSFAKEFEDGTFKDLLKQSKSTAYLLIVKSLPYWIMGLALWLPLLRISFPVLQLPLAEHKIPYWIVTSLFILSLTAMGVAVSIILKTQLKATEILMIVATPSFILSGQTWPMTQMPGWVQSMADVIPLTHYLNAIRKLIMYGADTADIMPQIQNLAIITVVCIIIGFVALKLKIRKTLKAENMA